MEGFSDWIDQAIVNMRKGMEKQVVQPRVVMERVLGQLQVHVVEDPEDSVFWMPVANMPDIRPVESCREREEAAASYMPPAPDGSRPGTVRKVAPRLPPPP